MVEFDTVPAILPARPPLKDCLASSGSPATLGGSAKPTLRSHSVDTIAHIIRTFDGKHAASLTFDRWEAAELKVSSQSHVIVLLLDGIVGGCEWSNGSHTGALLSVAPNTIIFNPARTDLSLRKRTSEACCILLLSIDPAIMYRIAVDDVNISDLHFHQQIGIDDQGIPATLLAIKQEIEAPGLNSRLYFDSLLMLLLTQLIRCSSNCAARRQPLYVKGGLPNWRLKRALELLETDRTETPSLAELAGPLRLHPTSFCRAFKQSTGLSPHRYLLEHRVNRAKKMMGDRKRTLTEIALDSGFSSSSQFSIVFKRITGITPRQYRLSL